MGYGILGNNLLGPLADPAKYNSITMTPDLYLGNYLPPKLLEEIREKIGEES